MLASVAESLAGRVGILRLEAMTPWEMSGRGEERGWLGAYLDQPASLVQGALGKPTSPANLPQALWRGSLPGLLRLPSELVPDYFSSYVQTYIERDVRTMGDIRDLAEFGRFLGLTAALTAQELNPTQLGREIGVAGSTARRWLDLLSNTYQWVELLPFHGNASKRISGKRKGHLHDTGLGCYLQRVSSPDALAVNPLLGALFETWCVNLVRRQFTDLGVPPQLYHWRTSAGAEVDLVLERDARLYPIEIKYKTNLTGHDTRGLRAFRETYGRAGGAWQVMPGLMIYAGTEPLWLDRETIAIPWNLGL
jgi:predicted AAA+ superfamily ATPase